MASRAERLDLLPVPEHELVPRAAPTLPAPDGGGGLVAMLPALSGLGSVAYLFAGARSTVTYAAGGAMVLSSLAMALGGLSRGRATARRAADRTRSEYARHLQTIRRRAASVTAARRARAQRLSPPPDELWTVVAGRQDVLRHRHDDDFLDVRVGVGPQALPGSEPSVEAVLPDDVGTVDAWAGAARARMVARLARPPDSVVTVPLREAAHVLVCGDRGGSLARALVAQAAALDSPDDLAIAVATLRPDAARWQWVKWLPHARGRSPADGSGTPVLIGSDPQWLIDSAAGRHLLLVLDGVAGAAGTADVTVVDLCPHDAPAPTHPHVALRLAAGRLVVHRPALEPVDVRPDALAPELAESLARLLAGRRSPATSLAATRRDDLPALLGIDDPRGFDVATLRRRRAAAGALRTPFGHTPDGTPILLDIKESARGGVGPHGLVVGATGSGKSELLRTLVLGMAAAHDSTDLHLVLVDFKGGATFAGLAPLPHVAAVITNLDSDLTLVDRMQDALAGELTRRQETLRAAGDVTSLRDYDQLRRERPDLPPLPVLWVVVDEFSELLAQKPDFADLFAQLGRLGRSLGVHLLLASQRIDEGRLRGLESHLSYRIGLRTFSEAESRAVLGAPDAFFLPAAPGHGYLLADGGGMQRFRAAYSSGLVPAGADPIGGAGAVPVRRFTAQDPVPDRSKPARATGEPAAGAQSVLDALVGRLSAHGPPAHRVWLPPLDAPTTLDRLLPDLRARPGRGFGSDPTKLPLQVPVGRIDRPFRQRRDTLVLDFAGSDGHVAIVGGPRSGKSTVLRTVITALALRHTPEELQVYGLDLGGTSMFTLAGLPHVGSVAGRGDVELACRTVEQISALVRRREVAFRTLGIDTMEQYRAARLAGRVDDAFGDVVLAVDGWAVLHQEFEDLEEQLVTLAPRALGFGVHMVLTAGRWLDLRFGLRDVVGGKLELKLVDALDSEVGRRAQDAVPSGRPGRGVTAARLQWLAALPRVDGIRSASDLPAGVAALVDSVAGGWLGEGAPPVRLLPDRVALADLPRVPDAAQRGAVILGLEGHGLRAVHLDPRQDQALIVLGDPGSGKTELLRSIAAQVVARADPTRVKVVIVDPRRTLLGEFTGPSVLGYAATGDEAAQVGAGLLAGFTERLPGAETTPTQLRDRSWWHGLEVYVLVDDYDLATATGNPLDALVPLLPHARDVGLHLVITRRAAGAGRALADPVLGSLRELGQPALVLSSPPEEGVLCGVRAARRPPGRGVLVSHRTGATPVQLATWS